MSTAATLPAPLQACLRSVCRSKREILAALLPGLQTVFGRHAHTSADSSTGGADSRAACPPKAKRFYKTVHVKPVADQAGYQVLLDSRPVKTPGTHLAVFPTYPLALAVAAEWEWQESGKPQLHTMPMMSLAATAIDMPRPRGKVIEHVMKYVHTDTTTCRYEDGSLARRQAALYDPILVQLRELHGWQLLASNDIMGAHQSDEAVSLIQAWLAGLDSWHLTAVEQLTSTCKSLVIAAALVRGHITPDQAIAASRLEVDFQTEEWGKVEAGHDLDETDMMSRVYAPSVFLRLLALQQGVVQ